MTSPPQHPGRAGAAGSWPGTRYGDAAMLTPKLVAELGGGRALLICGARSFEASGARRMLPGLRRAAQVTRWSDFTPNVTVGDLSRGLAVAELARPDIVIGVGGGSSLDMAKLLCAFGRPHSEAELWESVRGRRWLTSRRTRLVLVPTTSGSGSQATHFAVLYAGDDKYSVAAPALRPDGVVLDPGLAVSAGPYQRAVSGLDAVSHAIESLWAVDATDESRRYARRALRALLPTIEPFTSQPTRASSRAMAIGSHLAGRAIDISKTTVAHALSYGITRRYGVSHGHAVALTLGAFIEALAGADPSRLRPPVSPGRHARAMRDVLAALGSSDPTAAGQRFDALARRLGLPMRLRDVGIVTSGQVRELAAAVNFERLGNCPVHFSPDDLTRTCLTRL